MAELNFEQMNNILEKEIKQHTDAEDVFVDIHELIKFNKQNVLVENSTHASKLVDNSGQKLIWEQKSKKNFKEIIGIDPDNCPEELVPKDSSLETK